MWKSLTLSELLKKQQGRGNSAQRTAEDNRIFLSTSLTMRPPRFPGFPPARRGGGEPAWKGHRQPATALRKEGPWAALTQKVPKGRPLGQQRPAEGLLKPSFCDKGNVSLQWLLLCRLHPERWERCVQWTNALGELRGCLGMDPGSAIKKEGWTKGNYCYSRMWVMALPTLPHKDAAP